MPGLLTIEVIGSLVSLSADAVLDLELPFIWLAGAPMVHPDDLADFLDAHRHDARTRLAARTAAAELSDTRTLSVPRLQRAG